MRSKKILYIKIWIILIAIVTMLLVFPVSKSVIYADGSVVNSAEMDNNLFNKLVMIRGTNYLKSDSFISDKYKTIDLSGDDLIFNNSKNIEDVSGLTQFKFTATTTLNLSHNSIKTISSDVLRSFPKLETLIVSDNQLESIDITASYRLRVLIADNNKLTKLDATDMYATDGLIDLSSNYFKDFKDITLPNQAVNVNTTIKLYNNNIQQFEGVEEGYNVMLGLQGFQTIGKSIEFKQKMAYYKTDNSQKLKIVISQNGLDKYTIVDSEITEDKIDINLGYGKYEISYYLINDDGTVSEVSVKRNPDTSHEDYFKNNDYLRYYKYKEFDLVPSSPTYIYVFKGKEYLEEQIETITKVGKIEAEADEGCKIYYKISSGEWKEGSTIPIKRGGKYNIVVKAVSSDGLNESKEVNIVINAAPSLRFPSILIVIFIVVGIIIILGIGLPLLKKYVL